MVILPIFAYNYHESINPLMGLISWIIFINVGMYTIDFIFNKNDSMMLVVSLVMSLLLANPFLWFFGGDVAMSLIFATVLPFLIMVVYIWFKISGPKQKDA